MKRGSRLALTLMALGVSCAVLAATGSIVPKTDAQPERGAQPDVGRMLIEGLKATPGCIGVETAQSESGKACILAWFQDKASVVAWYNSPLHRRMMSGMGGGSHPPLEHVPDDTKSILVVASITPSDQPEIPGFPGPISQISIELFAALPGGAHVNGRLAPAEFEVPHMIDYTPAAGG